MNMIGTMNIWMKVKFNKSSNRQKGGGKECSAKSNSVINEYNK